MSVDLNEFLVEAVRAGLTDAVKQLLDEGVEPKADYSLALREAAANGNLEIVKLLLLMSGTKANDSSALQSAAENGHLEIVRLLLTVSDPIADSSWALQTSAENGHLEIVKLLLPVSDPEVDDSAALSSGGHARSPGNRQTAVVGERAHQSLKCPNVCRNRRLRFAAVLSSAHYGSEIC